LAVELLRVVKDWVGEMKKDGEAVRLRYAELQEAIVSLVHKAQSTKTDADRRLAEALRAAGREVGGSAPAGEDHIHEQGQRAHDLSVMEQNPLRAANAPAATALTSMNSLTRQLFDQLGAHEAESGKVVPHDNLKALEDDEAWKRQVIDLLFLVPGALPPLPQAPVDVEASPVDDDSEADEGECTGSPVHHPENGAESKSIVRYVKPFPSRDAKFAAETATNSSAALIRALRELRRVDTILQGCSAFWANMDSTVQKLEQMKDVTERLVGYASSSQRLRQRFNERLAEYSDFWASLEQMCKQYGLDHQLVAGKMHDFVRDLSNAADVIDTSSMMRHSSGVLKEMPMTMGPEL